MPDKISISTYKNQDFIQITDFLQVAYADTYPNDHGIKRAMFENVVFREHLKDYLKSRMSGPSHLWIARSDDKIVGTIGITLPLKDDATAEIWGFYVSDKLQGQGIGKSLWSAMLESGVLNTIRVLDLTVAKNSTKAKAFYERHGFKVTREEDWQWPSWTTEKLHNQYWHMQKRLD